jgi:hypothetical protein
MAKKMYFSLLFASYINYPFIFVSNGIQIGGIAL